MGDSPPSPSLLSGPSVFEATARIMIAAAIVMFVLIAFMFILHLYAMWFWSRNETDEDHFSPIVESRRGLNSSALKSLPIVLHNPQDLRDGIELECVICLSELQLGENVRLLPRCNHRFHVECIDKWFDYHSNCPICRTLVVSTKLGSESNANEVAINVNASGISVELPVFPTNVLFWGDQNQVASMELAPERGQGLSRAVNAALVASSASSSTAARANGDDETGGTRLRSLKRLLSRGKRAIIPSSTSSSSASGV